MAAGRRVLLATLAAMPRPAAFTAATSAVLRIPICPLRRGARASRAVASADAAPGEPQAPAERAAEPAADSIYHVPVLLDETLEWLVTNPGGIYVDGTLGGGGHASAILDRVRDAGGTVVGIDRDASAIAAATARLRADVDAGRLLPVHASFRHVHTVLRSLAADHPCLAAGVHGVLLDLGVSSHQIDEPSRGFSFRHDGPLDMRMDAGSAGAGAREFVNGCDVKDLARVLRRLGEERYAQPIARAIVAARPVATTGDLVRAVESQTPEPKRTKTLARVFQALRIHVNDELGELEGALLSAAAVVRPGGRLAVMSYHSLEDRRAKHVLRSGALDGVLTHDEMGNVLSPWKPLTRRPVVASAEEVQRNSRARSAKLRVAERTSYGGGVRLA